MNPLIKNLGSCFVMFTSPFAVVLVFFLVFASSSSIAQNEASIDNKETLALKENPPNLANTETALPMRLDMVRDSQLRKCIEALIPDDSTPLKKLRCHGKKIRSLEGLNQFVELEHISLFNNKISTIDFSFSEFKHLKSLNLARNQLSSLTVHGLDSLEKIYVFDNKITSFTIENLKKLIIVKANNNQIASLTYKKLPNLEKMYIFNNKIENLDIYGLPRLHYMDCRENPMSDELYDLMDELASVTFLHDGNAEDW